MRTCSNFESKRLRKIIDSLSWPIQGKSLETAGSPCIHNNLAMHVLTIQSDIINTNNGSGHRISILMSYLGFWSVSCTAIHLPWFIDYTSYLVLDVYNWPQNTIVPRLCALNIRYSSNCKCTCNDFEELFIQNLSQGKGVLDKKYRIFSLISILR